MISDVIYTLLFLLPQGRGGGGDIKEVEGRKEGTKNGGRNSGFLPHRRLACLPIEAPPNDGPFGSLPRLKRGEGRGQKPEIKSDTLV